MNFKFMMLLIVFIFILIGIIALMCHIRLRKRCTEKTKGKMIGVDVQDAYKKVGKTDYYFYPTCEYYVNNKRYITEAKCSTFRFRKLQGKEVNVYYNPEKVEDSYFEQDNTILVLAAIFIIVGIGMLIMTLMLM